MASPLRNSRISRLWAPSPPTSFNVQAPRRIGATSATAAICCGSLTLGEHGFAIFRQPLFGQRDHLDHAFVGFARAVAEAEDAVLVEDQALDLWIFVEGVGGGFGQRKARHDVRHEAEPFAVDLRAQCGRVRLIDQAEHRGRMGMVDEFRRHEGMQQGFDRRRGRLRIDQARRAARAPCRRRKAPRAPATCAAVRAAPPACRQAR